MDYVLGGVAALITGNVTPNRPRLLKRALTPTKHQPSPNVTPKSEFVEDRSIFLSPTMQKKKAIVKKSPKRIFQNPDLETTDNEEGNSSLASPKADKVKKHLKDDLEADSAVNKSLTPQKSLKKKLNNKNESITQESATSVSEQKSNENTPKKKKGKQISESESTENVINIQTTENVSTEEAVSPKKRKQKRKKSVVDTEGDKKNNVSEATAETPATTTNAKSPKKQKLNKPNIVEEIKETAQPVTTTKKKNKRRKKKSKVVTEAKPAENESNTKESEETNNENLQTENQGTPKKKNKRKKSKGQINKPDIKKFEEKPVQEENEDDDDGDDNDDDDEDDASDSDNLESCTVNPNAITDKESDSEHESDDEIESENEETNKQVFESEKPDESSDDDEEEKDAAKEKKEVKKKEAPKKDEVNTEDEIKRTLFVGNVPYSVKCKKEIKKIFGKHGQIETIRIRTVPIKDGRFTPKLALIKNELHPERTTVNVYIKYAEVDSIYKALIENNTVLNEHHLRVSRSDSTGAEHDPRCSVFIGNLPFAMEDEALRAKFENCGPIQSVRIIRDKKTNAGKGFGYVNFESKDGVELALALTEEDLTVKNRILRVKRCTQGTDKKKQPNQQRGGNFQDRPQRGGSRSGPGRGGRVSQGDRQRSGSGPPGNQGRGGFNSGGQRGGFNSGGRGGGRFNSDGQRGGFNSGGQRGGFNSGGRGGGRFNSDSPGRGGFNSGGRGGGRLNSGGDQGNRGGFKKFENQRNQGQKDEEGREGAFRRIMHKRKNEEGNAPRDGPPNKRPNVDQPNKEKKVRKEFVGMTAEKKKKQKFDKGQKKKKALSEILTK